MKKVVINGCHGGFGLSTEAYEKLIEWGVPVQKYVEQEYDSETRRYLPQPANDGEVIFDRRLSDDPLSSIMGNLMSHYWEFWIDKNREHPLLLKVISELGTAANGTFSNLTIVNIPDDVEYTIEEYDGLEHVAEKHRTWS